MKFLMAVGLFSFLMLCSNVNGYIKKPSSDPTILSTLMWSTLQLSQLSEEKIAGQQKAYSEFIKFRFLLALQGMLAGFVLTSIVRAHLNKPFDHKISLVGGGILGTIGFLWGMQQKYLYELYEKFANYSPFNEKLHAIFKKAGETNKDLLDIVFHAENNTSLCLDQVRMVYHHCEYPLTEALYDLNTLHCFTTKATTDCLFLLQNHQQLTSEQHNEIVYYYVELLTASLAINYYIKKLSTCPEIKLEIKTKKAAEETERKERSKQCSFEQEKIIERMLKKTEVYSTP